MASIARTSEYAVASVALLLTLSCVVGACSSSPPQETTGSVSASRQSYATTAPPVIYAPQTMAASGPTQTIYVPQRAAYRPAYRPVYRQAGTCNCNQPIRYDRRDVTASIPQTRPAYDRVNFMVHPIGPNDTLYSISRHYGVRMGDIAAVNRINTNTRLQVGELLVVPTGSR